MPDTLSSADGSTAPATAAPPRPITIAIAALGGQGGGVLANWLVDIGEAEGYNAQSTSVPGVAQRTGATVYYVELFPKAAAEAAGAPPVLALMPMPGDVDVVIASELMEAGRAMLRGLVTPDRTTLIASRHREFAISEKSAMGDGIANAETVIAAAQEQAKAVVLFDMNAAAEAVGSVISSILLGAVAGSGALPFDRAAFEAAITRSGVAVQSNLKGFALGFEKAERAGKGEDPDSPPVSPAAEARQEAKSETARALLARIDAELPEPCHGMAIEGVKRCVDYQDPAYADLYLDRLRPILALDHPPDYRLTTEAARYLALWMSFEDTIRVADLKTRKSRFDRVRTEVLATPDQIVTMTEFMHPRVQEVAETLPFAGLGRWILGTNWVRRALTPLFEQGRKVKTAHLSGFLTLSMVAALKPYRRRTLRFQEENARIEAWLTRIVEVAPRDYELAVEITEAQRLVKGYSDTHARGLRNFNQVMAAAAELDGQPDAASTLRALREAALKDEEGKELGEALAALGFSGAAAQRAA